MPCLHEDTLEFAALTSLRGGEVDAAVVAHMNECPVCLEAFNHFTGIHRGAVEKLNTEIPAKIREAVDAWLSNSWIELCLRPELQPPLLSLDHNRAAAADNIGNKTSKPPKNLGVFVSENEDVMVRVLTDPDASTLHLHVLTDHMEDAAGVQIRLQPGGLAGFTDMKGYLRISDTVIEDPQDIKLTVLLPSVKFFIELREYSASARSEDVEVRIEDRKKGTMTLGYRPGIVHRIQSLCYNQIQDVLQFAAVGPGVPISLILVQNQRVVECSGLESQTISTGIDMQPGSLCICIYVDPDSE